MELFAAAGEAVTRPVVLRENSTFMTKRTQPAAFISRHCFFSWPLRRRSGANIWSLRVSPAADGELISDVQVHLDFRFLLLFSQERLSVKTCLKWSFTELQFSHRLAKSRAVGC